MFPYTNVAEKVANPFLSSSAHIRFERTDTFVPGPDRARIAPHIHYNTPRTTTVIAKGRPGPKMTLPVSKIFTDLFHGSTVEAKGIALGEMDRLLHQKIEELTLYAIKQQELITLLLTHLNLGESIKKKNK